MKGIQVSLGCNGNSRAHLIIQVIFVLPSFVQGVTKVAQSPCGLYYKPVTIVNDDSGIINKFETSLIDDARVVIYDCHTLATGRMEQQFIKCCNFWSIS